MSYFIYLNNGNFTTVKDTDSQLSIFDAMFEVSDLQGQLIEGGATIELRDGKVVITPQQSNVLVDNAKENTNVEDAIITSNIISKMNFLKRFTPEEYATIKQAINTDSTVDYYWQLFMLAEELDLTFPDTINGINMLEQIGLISTGRAAEILA